MAVFGHDRSAFNTLVIFENREAILPLSLSNGCINDVVVFCIHIMNNKFYRVYIMVLNMG